MDKRLAAVAFSAPAKFETKAEDGTRRFSGVAYAGGVITDHGWFDRVAFDLATTKFATPAPALLSHNDPIGVVDKATVNGRILVEGNLFADVDGPAKNVAAMADRGMPWQLSVYIKPGSIEEFTAGQKVNLNGQTFDGPLTVFRNNRVREVSFCALGADDKTNATVFNIGGDEPPPLGVRAMEFTQAQVDAAVATAVTAEKANTDREKARADAAEATFKAQALTARTAAVKQLFADTGREFKDDVAKPYLEMSEEAFSVVAADLRAAKPKRDPNLFRDQATEGVVPEGDAQRFTAARQKIANQFSGKAAA